MTWMTAILVYVVIWWLLFFMALPVGVQAQNESEEGTVQGTPGSAPVAPKLGLKVLVVTLAAAALWGVVFGVIESGVVSLRG